MACLREVLLEAGKDELARALPWLAGADPEAAAEAPPEHLLQALSIAFQLLAMVEQRAAVHLRRGVETSQGPAGVTALWGEALGQPHERGIDCCRRSPR